MASPLKRPRSLSSTPSVSSTSSSSSSGPPTKHPRLTPPATLPSAPTPAPPANHPRETSPTEASQKCQTCALVLPSAHLLDLHISETHDSLTALRRERGERTFRCFVEDCERACSTARKRGWHVRDKHGLKLREFRGMGFWGEEISRRGLRPKEVEIGEDKGRIAGRRRGFVREVEDQGKAGEGSIATKSPASGSAAKLPSDDKARAKGPPSSKESPDTDMADLTTGLAALRFVPMSVQLRRSRTEAEQKAGGMVTD
ncbi:MAG: hypothetical protein M1814_003899 [Vezdaea aestivalis]|nr:MAG: hypothetical protein M1814_003899 [Vezdaea aestivalis]